MFTQNGLEKHQQGNFAEAIVEYSKAINVFPKNQILYNLRGKAYIGVDNYNEAKKDFLNALKISPDDFIAAYHLGMVYFKEKDLENAISWLKKAYINAEDYSSDHFLFVDKKVIAGNLGNFLIQIDQNEEGIKYIDEAIKIDSTYANAYLSKGFALVKIGKKEEGISYIKKASELGYPGVPAIIQSLKDY